MNHCTVCSKKTCRHLDALTNASENGEKAAEARIVAWLERRVDTYYTKHGFAQNVAREIKESIERGEHR